mgnify:CR=1 FL=1
MSTPSTPDREGFPSSEPQPGQDLWARAASGAPQAAPPAAPGWERDVLERLVFATVREQRENNVHVKEGVSEDEFVALREARLGDTMARIEGASRAAAQAMAQSGSTVVPVGSPSAAAATPAR